MTFFYICAIERCKGPLVNYKKGRFCQEHIDQGQVDICSLNNCQNAIAEPGALTCGQPEHLAFYQAWKSRYGHANFHGVYRAIKKWEPWKQHLPTEDEDNSTNSDSDEEPFDTGHTF
jgi:hypothetical protein